MTDTDEIKSRLDIVDIVGERVKLKKAGRNFKGLCPFHTEKTPSFVVSPDRQTFHCFGCGKGGDIFTFVMEYERVDFSEALETLAERAGVTLTRKPADTPEAKLKQTIIEANHLAGEYYQYLLTKHAVGEKARLYLKNRGISDKSIKTFTLGYSPNDWDGLCSFLHKKGYEPGVLEKAGLVLAGRRGHYDRFRGRIMFALKDHRGNIVGFSGRVCDAHTKEAKYINTSETPVYTKGDVLYALDVTKAAIQKANEGILMEGELDVISSFQAGISNVVAIKGSALTEHHARLLRRFTERLIFALDSDSAGDAASRRGIAIAESAGFDMRVLTVPTGKDPDEAVRENPGLFKKAIRESRPIYDYFLESAISRYDAKSPYGKKKIAEEYYPVLSKIENPIVRGHYIRKLSHALDSSEESIREGLGKMTAYGARKQIPKGTGDEMEKIRLTRLEKAELYLLSLMLQGKTAMCVGMLFDAFPNKEWAVRPVREIISRIREYMSSRTVFDPAVFAKTLPAELISSFDEAYLWDISEIVDDKIKFMREWEKTIREVQRLTLRKRMEDITAALRDPDIQNDNYTVLQTELRAITASLGALEKGA